MEVYLAVLQAVSLVIALNFGLALLVVMLRPPRGVTPVGKYIAIFALAVTIFAFSVGWLG